MPTSNGGVRAIHRTQLNESYKLKDVLKRIESGNEMTPVKRYTETGIKWYRRRRKTAYKSYCKPSDRSTEKKERKAEL